VSADMLTSMLFKLLYKKENVSNMIKGRDILQSEGAFL
jgi:hypothetical protein